MSKKSLNFSMLKRRPRLSAPNPGNNEAIKENNEGKGKSQLSLKDEQRTAKNQLLYKRDDCVTKIDVWSVSQRKKKKYK